MSLPGSSKGAPSGGNGGDGGNMLVTVMLVVTAIFAVVGTILLSIPLHDYYGKYLWNW